MFHQASAIDHVLINEEIPHDEINIQIIHDTGIVSDHRAIIADLPMLSPKKTQPSLTKMNPRLRTQSAPIHERVQWICEKCENLKKVMGITKKGTRKNLKISPELQLVTTYIRRLNRVADIEL